jgi:prepilin-type N-terminal cleavage/methylation domain-containing protein
MLLWRVRKSNSGFTLVEMLAVVIILGVIAAVAVPNLLGWFNRNRVNEAMRQVEGALKEAQKQAIRTGKRCTIDIEPTSFTIDVKPSTNISISSTQKDCLLSTRILNSSIALASNLESSNITKVTFSGKGNITIDDPVNPPVLVVSIPDGTDLKKCVVIENFLGVIRTGKYDGSGIPDSEICEPPNQ